MRPYEPAKLLVGGLLLLAVAIRPAALPGQIAQAATLPPPAEATAPALANRAVDFEVPTDWTRNYPTTEYVLSARSNQRLRPRGVYTFVPAFVGLRRTPLDRKSFRLDQELIVLRRVYDKAVPAQLPIQLANTDIKIYRLEAQETHLARHYLVLMIRKDRVYQADIMIPHFPEATIRQLEADAATALNSLQFPG